MRIQSVRSTDPWHPQAGTVTIHLDPDEAAMLAGDCRALAEICGRRDGDVELELRRASDEAADRSQP